MLDAALNHVTLLAEPRRCQSEFRAKLGAILAHDIFQCRMLELAPDPFVRIEIRCIARESFQMDACAPACRQKLLDRLPMVDGSTIPHDQHLARNLPQHMREKPYHVGSLIGRFLHQQHNHPDDPHAHVRNSAD